MIFIDYSIAFSHSTLLSLVLILIFPLVERFKYEPLARETGRTLPTSSAINKVHSLIQLSTCIQQSKVQRTLKQ